MTAEQRPQRLFLAVRPTPAAIRSLEGLPRDEAPGVRWTDSAQWHVTLKFFPGADPRAVIAAVESAQPARATVVLGPTVIRFTPRVVAVPAEGLETIATTIEAATRNRAEPRRVPPFRGHLTLARTRRNAVCPLVGEPFEGTFFADALELVASELRPDGAVHRTVRTWRLEPGTLA